ncbi:hypothetical protein EJ05DRAFT_171807 [Pseudovirgaria hyperparasitica]|uniref:Uncharacterized protein n=1 Tax=Pseudovirgaria hyperparasitica TaxID=470096 RepID=A0A6A6VT81_9PEZI|nr:uncharacterized protein EJ05DRAFT_171807 [Pseudovirgaria hyperparasitica]KAF2753792.1 hypothetical protein EJ05DRAFT_171807 [Pseudovirgaria hyperparasitica]
MSAPDKRGERGERRQAGARVVRHCGANRNDRICGLVVGCGFFFSVCCFPEASHVLLRNLAIFIIIIVSPEGPVVLITGFIGSGGGIKKKEKRNIILPHTHTHTHTAVLQCRTRQDRSLAPREGRMDGWKGGRTLLAAVFYSSCSTSLQGFLGKRLAPVSMYVCCST